MLGSMHSGSAPRDAFGLRVLGCMHSQTGIVRNMGCTVFSFFEEYPTRKPLQQGDLSAFKGKVRFVSAPGNNTRATHITDSQNIISRSESQAVHMFENNSVLGF